MIFWIIISIGFLSVFLAWISVRGEMKKFNGQKEVKEKLSKGRVIFYAKHTSK